MKWLLPILFLAVARLGAQESTAVLETAFTQLKGNGVTPFSRALFEGDATKTTLLVSQLKPIADASGRYWGYEIVSRKPLTSKVERYLLAIYFEQRPVYLRLDSYDTPKGKIWVSPVVSTEASDILPFDQISATGK